jgi:hypothetical protein
VIEESSRFRGLCGRAWRTGTTNTVRCSAAEALRGELCALRFASAQLATAHKLADTPITATAFLARSDLLIRKGIIVLLTTLPNMRCNPATTMVGVELLRCFSMGCPKAGLRMNRWTVRILERCSEFARSATLRGNFNYQRTLSSRHRLFQYVKRGAAKIRLGVDLRPHIRSAE